MVHLAVALVLILAATQPAAPAVGSQVALPAGTQLRALASPVAPAVAVVPEASQGEVLEVHAGWVRVRWQGKSGWVDRRGTTDRGAQSGAEPAPEVFQAPAEPVLDEARRRLGPELHAGHLGPFKLLTDVDDEALLQRLDTLARQLPPLFAERYGLRTNDDPREEEAAGWTVVLFADGEDYRALTRHVARAAGRAPEDLDYVGHAVGRLAFLSAEGAGDAVNRLFLHEAAHLLVRRSLGYDPPVWLDEGIAGDVEMMPVGGGGRLLPARLQHGVMPRHSLLGRSGPLARVSDLAERARRGRLPKVGELLDLDHRQLIDSSRRADLYALTAFFVHYLLEGGGSDQAQRFRTFLATGAGGDLPSALETDAPALDYAFGHWLVETNQRLALGRR